MTDSTIVTLYSPFQQKTKLARIFSFVADYTDMRYEDIRLLGIV